MVSQSSTWERLNDYPSEVALLGSVFLAPDRLHEATDTVCAGDFYKQEHATIFEMLCRIITQHGRIDLVMFNAEMERMGVTNELGGLDYLVEVFEGTPSDAGLTFYANQVAEMARKRDLYRTSVEVLEKLKSTGDSSTEIVESTQAKLFDLSQGKSKSRGVKLAEAAQTAYMQAQDRAEGKADLGPQTGYKEIDKLLGEMRLGEVTVLAARPSMGKSALAQQIGVNVAKAEHGVLFFSLEMSPESLAARSVASEAQINAKLMTNPEQCSYTKDDWQNMAAGVSRLSELNMHLMDTPGLTAEKLQSITRRYVETNSIKLVIVDYLGLMQAPGMKNRYEEVGYNSRAVKQITRSCNVHTILLAQLNRNVEHREVKMPGLSDLRDSGDIEQDADNVMFIHREDYYRRHEPNFQANHIADINIAKQRNGPVGGATLHYNAGTVTFSNWKETAF